MFKAKNVDFAALEPGEELSASSADGRGFAVSGGVAQAVVNCIKKLQPSREVKVAHAEGLDQCRQLMKDAGKGIYDGYLLEGMACPGGCVGGAGIMQSPTKSKGQVMLSMKKASCKNALDSDYREILPELEEKDLTVPSQG